ncbi:hypothetical protein CWO84_07325 [Methylomonas sp. Kb3]|uniref:hypothetical protein n=1 Tax=Methylomonas sp. Kb3 TaxID=1611544 RepID=UPI000C340CA6|nr:hypothetical protein [Methylomonas sp. Kb3]PKD41057.1 hypothetical protein CWO84_07325 [Methylomonas sp. Kb3]
MHYDPNEFNDGLNILDHLEALADQNDKVAECKYFLDLATQEKDKDKFRWLISAFFGAAYSYFEISALRAYYGFCDPKTGTPIKNNEVLATLNRYVGVFLKQNKPDYVSTFGRHIIIKQLYELRRGNTHHYPLSIMSSSQELPEGFQFVIQSNNVVPALTFCRETMMLIQEVDRELQQHF